MPLSMNDQENASPGVDDVDNPKPGEEEVGVDEEEEEEEEEEDVDFNPFLKETPSPEASSSLSSEVECFDSGRAGNLFDPCPNVGNERRDFAVGDLDHGEEVVTMNEACDGIENKRKRLVDEADDEDDAICKRTRARYSLASFTLDELETFLQETDDEDDLPNVDDEEEYRKFLAAVLQGGGDGDGQGARENGGFEEDEDEENDADFEIELEELLESDVDDVGNGEARKGVPGEGGRRPVTRQNRRQKASADYRKRLLEQTKRPLCPLLPNLPNAGLVSYPAFDGNVSMPEYGSSFVYASADGLINGFTPRQIGQLHCLIHEHVQLLVQVFSLSVLDASRQHVASQVQNLITEMLHNHDEAVMCRSISYPDVCFRPPNVCPSVAIELPNFDLAQCPAESSPASHVQSMVHENSPSGGRWEHVGCSQTHSVQSLGSLWLPFVSGPITSILDVAPLNLVGRYVDDVHNAVREYRQHLISSGCDTLYQKEPLFYLPNFVTSTTTPHGEVVQGDAPPSGSSRPLLPGQQPPKKSLAASIVEKAKTQSIALVQRDISKLAQRFLSLFNPALFPHKPPPVAVVNRILFTDIEDELLALGILEFNNDWKAIQQHFLPCKSKHQIFVRQKNRSSSKAPENPIKAARRLKHSPLTAEEMGRIREGLRIFKFDWPSVWRFAVPYRDPSLLPRQWRIALGTQRSYKSDAAKKEKRRIYEFNKRLKVAVQCQLASEKVQDNQANHLGRENNSGDNCADDTNETYVHRAFLADCKQGGTYFREQQNQCAAVQAYYVQQIHNAYKFPHASNLFPYPCPADVIHGGNNASTIVQPIHQAPVKSNASKSQICMLPNHGLRTGGAQVKLAPGLPLVNLPPSVRVIPQSAFKGNQCRVAGSVSASKVVDGRKVSIDLQSQQVGNMRTTNSSTTEDDTGKHETDKFPNSPAQTTSNAEELTVLRETCTNEGRCSDPVLEMHPLLFRAPEDGQLQYYPLSSGISTSSSFSFFSGNQPQVNLSLVHSPHQAYHSEHSCRYLRTKASNLAPCGIDFHPLLQRTDDENQLVLPACSNTQQFVCKEGKKRESQNSVGAVHGEPLVNDDPNIASPEPPRVGDEANELDLGIYLSSTSIKDKKQGSRGGDTYEESTSILGSPNLGNTSITQNKDGPHSQCRGNREPEWSSLVDVTAVSAIPSTFDCRCDIDDASEHPRQEIVMEQEELSDSDEEIEEQVEFECEEMTDSDSESLPCEPPPEELDKAPSSKNEVAVADHGHQQSELRGPEHPPDISSNPRKSYPMPKLNLRSLAKDATTCSWLSLDSSAAVDPPSLKAKHQCGEIDRGSEAKSPRSGRPNRSCKKTTSNMKRVAATQSDVVDMAQQLSLGPLAVSSLKKPRRRVSRINSSLRGEMTAGTSSSNPDK